MAKNNFSTALQRTIGQIQFRPTISSFEAISKSAKLLEGEFEDWITPKPGIMTLYTAKHKKMIEITPNAITYVKEGSKDTKELVEFVEKIFKKITTDYEVVEIRRIGFRTTQIIDCTFNFTDLVDLLYKKLYPQDNKFIELSGENTRDLMFVLDAKNNGILNHIQLGPLKKKEVLSHFNPSFESDINSISDHCLFVDTDIFVNDDINVENANEKLEAVIKESENLLKGYLDYLK